MRVFWPTRGLERSTGDVVGWRLQDTICVAAIVDDWMAQQSNSATRYRESSEKSSGDSKVTLELVGRAVTSPAVEQHGDRLVVSLDSSFLPITCSTTDIILYEPPDPRRLRFFSLEPPVPAPTQEAQTTHLARQDAYSVGSATRFDYHSADLEHIIPLLSMVKDVQRNLCYSPAGRDKHNHSYTTASIARLLELAVLPVTSLVETLLRLADTNVSILGVIVGSASQSSATVNQLSQRIKWLLTSPSSFTATLYDPLVPVARRSELYMTFWNTVWLIIENDLILGYCMRQTLLVLESEYDIAIRVPQMFSNYLVAGINASLTWLDEWPVGLKLNAPLSRFLCTSLQLVVTRWGLLVLPILHEHSGTTYLLVANAALGGLTLWLALLSDTFKLATLHLSLAYRLTSTLCLWQLRSLGGLWNLFRGKRWNVLRQRTDSYAYDVDQLFLGTLLFTVSAFLFPTVIAYAAFFGALRVVWLVMSAGFDSVRAALNAFPLFELMLRMKESRRLPSGIYFALRPRVTLNDGREWHCLELQNSPKAFKDILMPKRSSMT